jgi:membrane protease YdiL (CAAX protease family)
METDSIGLKTLFSAIALILLLEIVSGFIDVPDAMTLTAIGLLRLLEIASMLAVVFLFEKNVSCIGLDRSGVFNAVKKGAVWSVGFGLLAAIAALILFIFGFHPLQLIRVQLPSGPLSLALFFSVGGVIGPMAEEIFFRGLIFRFFRQWGFVFSLCFSTAIFAAMHPMSSGIPIPQIIGGLLFATAFEIEKNLLVPMILHILGNLALFSLPLLTV